MGLMVPLIWRPVFYKIEHDVPTVRRVVRGGGLAWPAGEERVRGGSCPKVRKEWKDGEQNDHIDRQWQKIRVHDGR